MKKQIERTKTNLALKKMSAKDQVFPIKGYKTQFCRKTEKKVQKG